MGWLRWLASSQKSLLKILYQQANCSNGVSCGRTSQFQRAFMHSPATYWRSHMGKHADFATYELLLPKRLVHATGVHRSVEHDYYKILGVSNNATRDEIKAAFRALAKKYHPDANKNNPTAKRKFQEIRDAYEILQDHEKKTQYDRIRVESSERTESSGDCSRDWNHFKHTPRTEFSDSFQKIFSEIFEEETENLADDIEAELLLTFSEAAEGCTKHLSVDADVPCDVCNGQGSPLNAEMKICPTCQGLGKVAIPPFITKCNTCKGFGRITKDYCMACKGSGVRKGVMEVKVAIPAGVDSGDTIRVAKAGNFGRGGRSSGNLFIKLKVADDPKFSREGADLYVDTCISFSQAILGGSIKIPTLSGSMQLQVPKGVQHGQLVMLRGKGLPTGGFFVGRGDQYVRFCIKFPSTVTERQRAVLEELEETITDENNKSPEHSWWRQYWVEHATDRMRLILEISLLALLIFLWLG